MVTVVLFGGFLWTILLDAAIETRMRLRCWWHNQTHVADKATIVTHTTRQQGMAVPIEKEPRDPSFVQMDEWRSRERKGRSHNDGG